MAPFRLFLCAGCRKQTQICQKCDRGQIYCSKECATAARRQTQRGASKRYQQTPQGQSNHRRRQQEYRARLARVTHQGSHNAAQSS